jgi:hypothetical protein
MTRFMRLETPLDPEQPLPRPNPKNSVVYKTENSSVAELEPEPKFGILAPWGRSRKNIFGSAILKIGTVPGDLLSVMEFLDIKITNDSSLLLHAMHGPFYWRILMK